MHDNGRGGDGSIVGKVSTSVLCCGGEGGGGG